MILSHRHRFIFIKTAKTAGTSIEIALSRFCGPSDIITPISSVDEQARISLGYPGAQNYLASSSASVERTSDSGQEDSKAKLQYYNHMPAIEVLQSIGQRVFDRYYKFCFERNPFDRLISLYYFVNRSGPRPTFVEFLRSPVPQVLRARGLDLYSSGGDVLVDRIGRYEHIVDDLEEIRKIIGLPEPLILPRAKSSFRPNRKHHREFYGPVERRMVEESFAMELDLFGYKF